MPDDGLEDDQMTNTIKFAAIGCGRVSQRYAEVFRDELSGGMLVGCCDLDAAKATRMADAVGGNAVPFTDWEHMLADTQPDVVCILTESGHHYRDAMRALSAGCHVVVEKPVAMLPEQGVELDEAARKSGLLLSLVMQNRLNPAIRKLRETVQAGRFGKIVTATIRLRWCRYQDYYNDGWHGTWAMDGGVINQQAIHHVDALDWICGPLTRVCAVGQRQLMKLDAEDTLVAVFETSPGTLGTIEATTAARPRDIEASLSVVGENGVAVIGGIALNEIKTWDFVTPEPEDVDVPNSFSQEVPTGYGLSHGPYLQEIVDRLGRGDTTPIVSGRDGAATLEVVHALYRSWEDQGWVARGGESRSRHLGQGA